MSNPLIDDQRFSLHAAVEEKARHYHFVLKSCEPNPLLIICLGAGDDSLWNAKKKIHEEKNYDVNKIIILKDM
jgi:hypothetical protein